MTEREYDILQTILHHVASHNGRPIVAVHAQRCANSVGLIEGCNMLIAARGDLVIDGVEFSPVRGRSA